MDRHGGCTTAAKAIGVGRFVVAKTTLQFLALVSFFSFAYSYLLSFSSYNNIQFSTLIFSLFAHSTDRKFMFFLCNGIVAFLVNNLNFSSSTRSININAAELGVYQTSELPLASSTLIQENVASVEFEDIISAVVREEETKECGEEETLNPKPAKDELEEENGEEEKEQCSYQAVSEPAEDELDEEELEEDKGEESRSIVQEVNDVSVSTEELNHKCEEFIRKMKEEIRIEAQQQLVAV